MITLEWSCKTCGGIRRVEVTDPVTSILAHKPAGWSFDDSVSSMCDRCTTQGVTSPHPARSADQVRDQLSGLRAGGHPDGQSDQGIRQPPQPYTTVTMGGGSQDNVLRDHEGNPIAVIGPGGGGSGGPGSMGYGGADGSYPRHTTGAAGGGADAQPRSGPIPVPSGEPDSKVYRPDQVGPGGIAFEDTRSSEFLGPEKVVAGVPSLSARCVGVTATGHRCGQVIADGSRWRMANGSVYERGHSECLDRAGR